MTDGAARERVSREDVDRGPRNRAVGGRAVPIPGRRDSRASSGVSPDFAATPAVSILTLQRLAGNQAVGAMLAAGGSAPGTQRKRNVDAPEAPPDEASESKKTPKKDAEPITGYVGMNPDASKEIGALKGASREAVRTTTGDAKLEQRLKDATGIPDYVSRDLGIDAGQGDRYQKAIDALTACDPVARDTLGELMRWMNQAEQGQISLDRLVLSGHSNGFQFWGDSERRNAPQHPGTLIIERDLGNVTALFPGAAGQVRSIMFSACETVGAVETVIRLFPNLDSVWAYAGFSPDIGQGSPAHIQTWARATEGAKTPAKDAARGSAAIWTKKDGFIVNDPGAGSVETAYTQAMAGFVGVGNPMIRGERPIEEASLNELYERLHRVIAHPAATKDQKETMTQLMEVILRLRHWDKVRARFAATYGPELVEAYRQIELTAPDWASISRKALTAHLEALDKAYESHPDATAAHDTIERLVHRGLARLDPEVIPPDWN
jgi:hypothetical protein